MKQKLKDFIWNDLLQRLSTFFAAILGMMYFLILFFWFQENNWKLYINIEPLSTFVLSVFLIVFFIIIVLIDKIQKTLKLDVKLKCFQFKIIKLIILFFYAFYFIFTFAAFCFVFATLLMLICYFVLDNFG